MSQGTLAERSGTSQPTVASYESGRCVPRLDTLERLFDALGYDVDLVVTPRLAPGAEEVADVAFKVEASLVLGMERQAWHVMGTFLECCRLSSAAGVGRLVARAPGTCGYRRFDAAVAAVAELACAEAGLPNPEWTEEKERFVSPAWNAAGSTAQSSGEGARSVDETVAAQSPICFTRHGVLVTREMLGRR